MAYGLKYTQYIERGGAQVQIKVYQKGWTGTSYGMAHVTSAELQLIGGQSDILSALVKTAFSFSLVDAYDEGATQSDGTTCVNAMNEKCGQWEEFFTPDATKYKVEVLSRPAGASSASVIWTGFVTPDSWSEDMIYRGSITVTARDMLGALQDKEFDLTGRVSVRDLITGALTACECPMALQLTEGHFLVNSNGHSVLDHTFSAEVYSGDTWADALEKTLESLGLVLRYNGANKIVLTSLRYIAADTTLGVHSIEFISRSGLRQLEPALKSITETFDVDLVDIQAVDPAASQFAATGGNLTQVVVAHSASGGTYTNTNYIPAYTLTEAGGEGWSGGLATPPLGTPKGGVSDRKMWFPTDVTDAVSAVWHNPRLRGNFVIKIEQDGPIAWLTGSGQNISLAQFYGDNSVDKITLQVRAVVNGTTKYLAPNGDWDTAQRTIDYVPGNELSVPDNGAVGIEILVKKVITACSYPAQHSIFVALNLEVIPATSSTTPTEYKTTTDYDEANNVVIKRDPTIGSANMDICALFVQNVLAYGDSVAADKWNWSGVSGTYPLAVMIQAQVLCFHAAAASVFTGTAHDTTTPDAAALPGYRINYYNRTCVLLSGVFGFRHGFVGQVAAREYYTWEEVWGTFNPDYTEISGPGKGSTSAAGSSSSGGSGGGGGGVYSLPLAADGVRGGIQVGYTQSGKNYPVQLDNEKAYVNVPWTDTNTWRPLGDGPTDACAGDDPRLSNSRHADDVYPWAKAATKPSYNLDEVEDGATRKLANYVEKAGDTMSGQLIIALANALGLKLKRTETGSINIDLFPDNQETHGWRIGAYGSADNYMFRFTYDGADKAYLKTDGTLQVAGDLMMNSDATKKVNLKDIVVSLEQIAHAPAVSFDWKDGGHSFGSIAQYWKSIVPESVQGDEGNHALAYSQLAVILIVNLAREVLKIRKELERINEK